MEPLFGRRGGLPQNPARSAGVVHMSVSLQEPLHHIDVEVLIKRGIHARWQTPGLVSTLRRQLQESMQKEKLRKACLAIGIGFAGWLSTATALLVGALVGIHWDKWPQRLEQCKSRPLTLRKPRCCLWSNPRFKMFSLEKPKHEWITYVETDNASQMCTVEKLT